MTHGHPPQPPSGGQPPHDGQQAPPAGPPSYGQQPPPHGSPAPPPQGQPQYGQPPGYAPPPGQPSYGPPQYGQQPPAQPYGPPAASPGAGISFDLKKLTMADYVIAGGTLLFFVLALFPWWTYDDLFGYSLSGFDDSTVSTAFLLFLLATVWTLLPAFVDLRLGFPRAWVTVGLAALGFVLTLVAWIESLGVSFQIWPLLGLLTAGAILAFAILSLMPQLRDRPALPGSLAGAAQWANQPAPDLGRPGQQAHTHGQAGHGPAGYGQAAPPPPPPPPPGYGPGTSYPGPGSGAPPVPGSPTPPGGATASGEGAGAPDRPAGT